MTRDDIMHQIREHDDFLILHGIKRIGLFGSYARGDQREESDIDLLVEFRIMTSKPPRQYIAIR